MRKPIRLFAIVLTMALANAAQAGVAITAANISTNNVVNSARTVTSNGHKSQQHKAPAIPEHPKVDPDVLKELFIGSKLVQCFEKGLCVDVDTSKPTETPPVYAVGFQVVFDPEVMDKLALTPEEFLLYRKPIGELYDELVRQKGLL